MIIAAILHDVVEDSDCTVEVISEEFNPRIAQVVQRVTRIVHDEYSNLKKLSIEEILDGIVKADDKDAMLLKEI